VISPALVSSPSASLSAVTVNWFSGAPPYEQRIRAEASGTALRASRTKPAKAAPSNIRADRTLIPYSRHLRRLHPSSERFAWIVRRMTSRFSRAIARPVSRST
jgi:hypothetical protein